VYEFSVETDCSQRSGSSQAHGSPDVKNLQKMTHRPNSRYSWYNYNSGHIRLDAVNGRTGVQWDL